MKKRTAKQIMASLIVIALFLMNLPSTLPSTHAAAADGEFDPTQLTAEMMTLAMADLYAGNETISVHMSNYRYFIGPFVGSYRSLVSSLNDSPWFTGSMAVYNALSWTPSEIQQNPAYYHELVVLDILNNTTHCPNRPPLLTITG